MIPDHKARFNFSLNTCNGCHGKETQTSGFTQLSTRQPNQESILSDFLKGQPPGAPPITDICGGTHKFNDIDRRRVDLCQLLDKTCSEINSEPVVTFVH
jgi:hypothetical protein